MSDNLPERQDDVVDGEIVEEVEVDVNPDRLRMRAELEQRRAEMMEKGHIDNGALFAGSSMHFYCKYCGVKTAVLPELYLTPPKKICDDCETLIEFGWHDGKRPAFPRQDPATGKPRQVATSK